MRGISQRMALLAVLLITSLSAAGCGGPNVPCETDLAVVDAARDRAAEAERKLLDAERRQDELEREIATEKRRKAELQAKLTELEARISELER